MTDFVFYITHHGFGHATREVEVINRLPPSIGVEVVSQVPRWLLERSLHRPFTFREYRHDPGVAQHDTLTQDVEETYRIWTRLLDEYPRMARLEAERLSAQGTRLVVGDISPFAVAVARTAGLPSVIIANFSWDWICAAFLKYQPRFQILIDAWRDYYRQCDLLLRTPFAGDLSIFPQIVDLPIIARKSRLTRAEARHQLGLRADEKVALVSFGGHGFQLLDGKFYDKFPDVTFLTFGNPAATAANLRWLDPQSTYHPDVVCAADVVVTKLGYGIVTECVAHGIPIAYPPRENFPEFEVLENEVKEYVPAWRLDRRTFERGDWDFLPAVFDHPWKNLSARRTPQLNGGVVAAEHLLQRVGLAFEAPVGSPQRE